MDAHLLEAPVDRVEANIRVGAHLLEAPVDRVEANVRAGVHLLEASIRVGAHLLEASIRVDAHLLEAPVDRVEANVRVGAGLVEASIRAGAGLLEAPVGRFEALRHEVEPLVHQRALRFQLFLDADHPVKELPTHAAGFPAGNHLLHDLAQPRLDVLCYATDVFVPQGHWICHFGLLTIHHQRNAVRAASSCR